MTKRSFFNQLGGLSVGVAALLIILNFLPQFQADIAVSWISWLFFILFTIAVFYIAQKAALGPNPHTFTTVIMGVVIGKMFFSVLIILLYVKLMTPESRYFLLPFFTIYFSFTIFELHFMTKLGKMKP
jgi:hypothetical protein